VSKYFTTIFKKLVPAGHAVLVMKKDTGDVSQQWFNYSAKGGGSLFPQRKSNMTGDMYNCISVIGNCSLC